MAGNLPQFKAGLDKWLVEVVADTARTVRHLPTGESFVVTSCHAGRATAVRTADVSDPREWERVPDGR
jgi:hypothetical protein